MALLKRRDLLEGNPLAGSNRASTHGGERYNARQTVFPAGSPKSLGQKEKPKKLSRKIADKGLKLLSHKAEPLLEARAKANKVYGDSYFENHYPLADKDLKTIIDKMVMTAHSRVKAKGNEEPEEEEREEYAPVQPVTIVVNIGDMKHGT